MLCFHINSLSREKRYLREKTRHIDLYLSDVQISDEGSYECSAELLSKPSAEHLPVNSDAFYLIVQGKTIGKILVNMTYKMNTTHSGFTLVMKLPERSI